MNILDILSPKSLVVPLKGADKKAVIEELVDLLAAEKLVEDAQTLKQVVWEREKQRTTGIGEGLAIPHGKSDCAKGVVMAIGKPASPLHFDSIDGKPVQLVVLLISPPEKTSEHIQALGKMSRLMADPKFRTSAYTAGSAESLYKLFKSAKA